MVRSSPRASAGFRMLAASFWPGGAARADHRVGFVDEENDRRGRRLHFFHQPLQPVFEFALDAGAGLQQRQIERAHGDVAQTRRHIAVHDALREAFHHRGLADAGFARQDRVVLPAAGEDVHHLADLEVAPQHRIDLALARVLRQVDRELIQVLRLAARGFAAPERRRRTRAGASSASAVYSRESARMAGSTLRSASASIFGIPC